MTLKREITFSPAYDHTEKRGGVHGVDLRFVLKGEQGAVQFVLFTNWHLPQVQERLDKDIYGEFPHLSCHPMPADLGYHSPVPRYEDQWCRESCEYLDGKPCYCDGSELNAIDVYGVLVTKGSEGVWEYLAKYYAEVFETKEMKG